MQLGEDKPLWVGLIAGPAGSGCCLGVFVRYEELWRHSDKVPQKGLLQKVGPAVPSAPFTAKHLGGLRIRLRLQHLIYPCLKVGHTMLQSHSPSYHCSDPTSRAKEATSAANHSQCTGSFAVSTPDNRISSTGEASAEEKGGVA